MNPDDAAGGSQTGDFPPATPSSLANPEGPLPTIDGEVRAPGKESHDAAVPPPGAVHGAQRALEAAVDKVSAQYSGTLGVAVAGAGQVYSAGSDAPLTAWSTSKVPVAIAAQRAGVADAALVSQAITYSDNAAAESLWSALGGGQTAATATEAVLGDASLSLTVPAEISRPGFSAYGQTQWSVPDQARFASNLRCLSGSEQVVQAMGQQDPAQAYGLGSLDGAMKKGGWGPDAAGRYEARQMGVVQLGGHEVALAVYASAADGSYGQAQAMLTALVQELAAAKVAWPSPQC
ncbi:hypothetical protein [Corynebacterium sp.]|uniref:hypothetical protein n=1 Tax=Corynebacterium sp. TaxID=1720 RepID=UPI0026DBAD9D|nr:hypothetical protein [Corynebacterium sp.]MDO5032675.1 hypothetical protein [Corynebacterium sp.]